MTDAQQQAQARQQAQSETAQAQAVLQEMNNIRAAQQAQDRHEDDEPPPPAATVTPEPMPEHQIPVTAHGLPTAKAQRNFTDAESRIMKTGDGFLQGYNAQAVVDQEHQIIVADDVSNQSPDAEHLVPMLDRTVDNCGVVPARMSGDTGYYSEANVLQAQSRGVDIYLALKRHNHGAGPTDCGETSSPQESETKKKMRSKLATEEGAKIYSRRKVIVEPAYGQIKNRGFRSFLLRGIQKVRGKWSLMTLTHNLLKLYKAQQAAAAMGNCGAIAA